MSPQELVEAVETNRLGYAADPDAYAERLADSLRGLADALEREQRYDEALAPARQAVPVARHALESTRGKVDYPLYRALKTLTRVAQRLDRPEIALTAVLDSAAACRRLAAAEAGALDEWLARQLDDYDARLSWLGAAEQALAVRQEVVAIYRRLFAEDPDRYGDGLRTAIVGLAGRLEAMGRPAEALAARRERYIGLTTDSPIEELDVTLRTYNLLKRMDCHTIGDIAGLGVLDFLYRSASARWVPDELNSKLALMGLGPLAATATRTETPWVPDAPDWTFGALCVLCPGEDAVAQVREAVVAAYAVDGVHPVDRAAYNASAEHEGGFVCELEVNGSARLGADLVVIHREAGEWIGVKSEHWELAPQGRHPLALRLSAVWPVLSVTATEDVAYEVCLYTGGAPTSYSAHGDPEEPPPVDVPLDFHLLSTASWLSTPAADLREVFGEPDVFANFAGVSSGGLRHLLDSAPLSDHPAESVLYLRRP